MPIDYSKWDNFTLSDDSDAEEEEERKKKMPPLPSSQHASNVKSASHMADGSLVVELLDGKKFVMERAEGGEGGNVGGTYPTLAEQVMGKGGSCYHGSTEEAFRGDMQRCMDTFVEWQDRDVKADRPLAPGELSSFMTNYAKAFSGRNAPFADCARAAKGPGGAETTPFEALARHAFAWSADAYLNTPMGAARDARVFVGLSFAVYTRYCQVASHREEDIAPASRNARLVKQYTDLIKTDTGRIRCLAKHLPCDCFRKLMNVSVVGVEVAFCDGCMRDFPSKGLMKCGKCGKPDYCSKECQVRDWHARHKTVCKEWAKEKRWLEEREKSVAAASEAIRRAQMSDSFC